MNPLLDSNFPMASVSRLYALVCQKCHGLQIYQNLFEDEEAYKQLTPKQKISLMHNHKKINNIDTCLYCGDGCFRSVHVHITKKSGSIDLIHNDTKEIVPITDIIDMLNRVDDGWFNLLCFHKKNFIDYCVKYIADYEDALKQFEQYLPMIQRRPSQKGDYLKNEKDELAPKMELIVETDHQKIKK